MSRVIVIGSGVTGLGAAIALSDRGHQVELLERGTGPLPTTVPDAAAWVRPTVPQGVHSHAFASLGCNLLRERATDVYEGLLAAGAAEINLADYHPPMLADFRRRPADDELRMLLSRRSTFELVLRERALARPGVTLVTDATVRGLVTSGDDVQRVTGVRTADGNYRLADLVVDASGRRTAADTWLAEADLPVPQVTSESSRIVYYTRHYRQLAATPPGPLNRGFGAGGLWGSYTAVLFRGDNGTFSISVGVLPEDDVLKKALRTEAGFTAAVAATPLLAGWVAPGSSEPISPVHAMGGIDNSLRLPAADAPTARGFFALGDSVCTTNPAYGRGVSLGLSHAFLLADLLDEFPRTDAEQAAAFAKRTEHLLRPWFEEAVANDRGRAGLWEATVAGLPPQRPPAGVVTFGLAAAVSAKDEEVWRRVANVMMMLAPPTALYADEEIRGRIGRALAGGPPPELPGAGRTELVAAVVGAAAQAAESGA